MTDIHMYGIYMLYISYVHMIYIGATPGSAQKLTLVLYSQGSLLVGHRKNMV